MTDSPRIIRAILSISASTLVQLVFGFLSVAIAARVIPEEDFGVYFLVLAVVFLLQVFGNIGLHLSAAKFVAGAMNDRERAVIVNNLLTFRLLTVVGIVVLAYLGRPLLLRFYPSDLLTPLFYLVPLLACAELIEGTLSHIMQGFHLYRKMAIVQALTSALNLILVVVLLIGFGMGVRGFIAANILSVSTASVVRYMMIPTRKALAFDRELARRILRFGLPLQANDFLMFVIKRVDVLIVGALVGPAHIAYLEVAARIPAYFSRLARSLQSVYFPEMAELFSRKDGARALDLLHHVLRVAAFCAFGCALTLTLFGTEVMVLVFSDQYLPSVPALGILMVVMSISVTSGIVDTAFVSAGRPAYVLIPNGAMAVVALVANVTLIPRFGFLGAAAARLASDLVGNPISVWCARRTGVPARMSGYLKPAAVAAICAAPYLLLGWTSVLARVSLIGLFLALNVALSVITRDDLKMTFNSLKLRQRAPVTEG